MTIEVVRGGGGGGGVVWVISGKNILLTGFQGKQILARKYLKKKIPTLTKISFKACKAGKKSLLYSRKKFYHQRFGGKNFVPKPNHPYRSQKSNGQPLSCYVCSVISGNSLLAQFL